MKKIIFLIIALILITLLVSAYGSETVPSGRKQETAGLTVDITDLTEEPMFIDAEADGIAMQLFNASKRFLMAWLGLKSE